MWCNVSYVIKFYNITFETETFGILSAPELLPGVHQAAEGAAPWGQDAGQLAPALGAQLQPFHPPTQRQPGAQRTDQQPAQDPASAGSVSL